MSVGPRIKPLGWSREREQAWTRIFDKDNYVEDECDRKSVPEKDWTIDRALRCAGKGRTHTR